MQLTFAGGTGPFAVGELKVHETVSTRLPACRTVIVALVKAISVIFSVHEVPGQSGAPGIGVVGESVVTLNGVLPFLSWPAGISVLPVTDTCAGLCPGG